MKSIPYGVSDYERIATNNYYYVDKTHYIPLIERGASYFFFIRPRRFGKSLMLNVLDAYYDINNENRFEELFGERWIYKNPTSLRAKFLVLSFNFSAVDNDPAKMIDSFNAHCKICIKDFLDRYERFFPTEIRGELEKQGEITAKLQYLNSEAARLKLRIYLIIDEYDNFTNSILANYGETPYHEATHGSGFFRYFFNILKQLTTGNGKPIERMFITGVSPVTMDDITSGYNIGVNFTTDAQFNGMVGFSETELRTMLDYYQGEDGLQMTTDEMIGEMRPWYNNYCFAEDSLDECMYNSDMVLYYIANCLRTGTPPRELIDPNIRTDYSKLRHLIKKDKEINFSTNLSIIGDILNDGYTTARLSRGFPIEELTNPDNFKSLLYYFGLVSIQGVEAGEAVLGIPNHTVREQMYDYLVKGLEDANAFRVDLSHLASLMKNMAYRGEWHPVFSFIADQLKSQSSVREFINGEGHVRGFLQAYLGLSNLYIITGEREMNKGYADLFFQPNPRITDIPFAYIVEVKYAKQGEELRVEELKEQAHRQLTRYAKDAQIENQIGGAKLRLLSVVWCGWDMMGVWEV